MNVVIHHAQKCDNFFVRFKKMMEDDIYTQQNVNTQIRLHRALKVLMEKLLNNIVMIQVNMVMMNQNKFKCWWNVTFNIIKFVKCFKFFHSSNSNENMDLHIWFELLYSTTDAILEGISSIQVQAPHILKSLTIKYYWTHYQNQLQLAFINYSLLLINIKIKFLKLWEIMVVDY